MRIRKPLAIVIGLLTIWPFVYMLLFVLFFVVMVFSVMQHLPQQHQSGSGIFPYIVIPHVGTILLMFALMAFYIVHVFKNAALKDDRRTLWAVVLFMGLPFSAPVYWWLFIWRPARGHEIV